MRRRFFGKRSKIPIDGPLFIGKAAPGDEKGAGLRAAPCRPYLHANEYAVRDPGASSARRPAAAAAARRHRRPGPSDRPERPDRAYGGAPAIVLDGPLGAARLRQDDDRSAPGRGHRSSFRSIIGGVFRGRRIAQGVRRGKKAARDRPWDFALRRRDPPLQPGPAGRVSAGCRGRHRGPGRGDDRKSVLRADRRLAVARPGVRAAPARRRRPRSLAASGRAGARVRPAADRRGARRAARDGRRRRPLSVQPGRGDRPPAGSTPRSDRSNWPNSCSAARRFTTRPRKATTI